MRGGVKAITTEKELVKVHPSSINDKVQSFPSPYLTYFLKRKSTEIYLFDTTAVSPLALLFASPCSSLGRYDMNLYDHTLYVLVINFYFI